MRAGEAGWEVTPDGAGGTWRINREAGQAWPKKGWGTDFSCFRFAVPELCGFEGRAIYLDADMLVLHDIKDLWDRDLKGKGVLCCNWKRTDVSLIDCSWFKGKDWWPSIEWMKASGKNTGQYCILLAQRGAVHGALPWEWNDCDGQIYNKRPGSVKLLHYTHVQLGQPYRPYPNIDYPPEWPHCIPSPSAGELWHDTYAEAKACKQSTSS